MTVNCPLCHGSTTSHLETLSGEELNILYARSVGIPKVLRANQLEYRECPNCKLRFFWPMETGNEALYEQLQAFDWYYMADKEEYQIAMRHLPKEGYVLEVGAGRAAFASLVGVDRYTGLEFNDKAIERAVAVGITLIKEAVEIHAKRNLHQYDAVVSFQVLEHVSTPAEFIKGCVDCLKPGGSLILAVPSSDGFAGEAINNFLDMPPHHVSHWSEITMRKIADLYGLEVISIEYEPVASYHQYWARKVKIESSFRRVLGVNFRLLNLRFFARLISKVAGVVAHLSRFSLVGIKGHTVLACYRKV